MELVVDANRIIAALIKDSQSRSIIVSRRFRLHTIEFGVKEVEKYKNLIKKKACINEQQFSFLMNRLLSKIRVYSEKEISEKSAMQALELMEKIDIDDVPFIALSLELNKPIWSDDKHFKQQKKIRVYTTKELAKFI